MRRGLSTGFVGTESGMMLWRFNLGFMRRGLEASRFGLRVFGPIQAVRQEMYSSQLTRIP